jgi:radical SAM protein with 4Fe4S-binding SPASM domain
LTYPPRQINISLHDLEENVSKEDLPRYIESFLQFADKISETTYINLRLWNRTDASLSDFNQKCISVLSEKLGVEMTVFAEENLRKGIHLRKHIYLQNANRFEWPNVDKPQSDSPKTCYALKDHIAILSDGSIVPCCIDADAHLHLGNIYTDDLWQVVHTKKALLIKEGFARKEAIEDFCKVCGFR